MSIGISVHVEGRIPRIDHVQAQQDASDRVGRYGREAASLYFGPEHDDEGETLGMLRYRHGHDYVEWYDEAPQALWIEEGTGLEGPLQHWIEPVTAQAMSWDRGGERVFAARTRGIEPDPWLEPAIKDSSEQMIDFYGQELEEQWNNG